MTDFTKPGYYRTRDGRKAEVLKYYTDDTSEYPIKGAVYDDGEWQGASWGDKGNYLGLRWKNQSDLIAPWEEKKTYDLSKMWVGWADGGDGEIARSGLAYPSKEAVRANFVGRKIIAITPATATTFTEGEGLE